MEMEKIYGKFLSGNRNRNSGGHPSFVPSETNEQQEHFGLLQFFMPSKCLFDLGLTEKSLALTIKSFKDVVLG